MIVKESKPIFSNNIIPFFPFTNPFKHQDLFFKNKEKDIILKSSTCSGKTDAFLFSFINDFKEFDNRIKCLYLAPTKLLMESQFENITEHLFKHGIKHTILRSGYTFAELFKKLAENDFIISSPDIIFYILFRKGQHIISLYEMFIKRLHCIVFDELHLFDTYTMVNIHNLIKIIKNIKPELNIYLLSATMELKGVIDPIGFILIDGISFTCRVKVKGVELYYRETRSVETFLKDNDFIENTIYVSNSVDRAIYLHKKFKDSALLVGKMWYSAENEEGRIALIIENLEKTKKGALTFTTSVFRQGVDIGVKTLITEEPRTSQDAVQTFGRCGRKYESNFIILTGNSPLLSELNSDKEFSRNEFENELEKYFRPQEYETQKRMMTAMWYKLYQNTKLKKHVEFLITEEMIKNFREFEEFLPDVSFREPYPSIKYNDLGVNIFELLKFKDIWKNFYPIDDEFYIAELKDSNRLINREYRTAKKGDLPEFLLVKKKRFEGTDYYNLTLEFNGIQFRINAKVGGPKDHQYIFINEKNLKTQSFEPIVFFERCES